MPYVRFTEDGIPGWFGEAPVEGAVLVEGVETDTLLTHRRNAKGKWVLRAPVVPTEPTQEERAAASHAAHQAELAARSDALREALSRDADPVFFQWQRGEALEADWLGKVAEVKARFPKPEAP